MKPALRLTWRIAPYMLFSVMALFVVVSTAALLLTGLHGALSLFILLWTIYLVVVVKMIVQYMGGAELAKELKERGGKPVKVFRPGKKNCRFIAGLGWGYEWTNSIVVFVNPRQDKYTLTKHLFLLDPRSTDFSNQLLEVAVVSEKALKEISSKVSSDKYRASSDLRVYESALAISESIQDIVK